MSREKSQKTQKGHSPRVGVVLRMYDGSPHLQEVLRPVRMLSLARFAKEWPDERRRRELKGYDAAEWWRVFKRREEARGLNGTEGNEGNEASKDVCTAAKR